MPPPVIMPISRRRQQQRRVLVKDFAPENKNNRKNCVCARARQGRRTLKHANKMRGKFFIAAHKFNYYSSIIKMQQLELLSAWCLCLLTRKREKLRGASPPSSPMPQSPGKQCKSSA